MLFCFDSYALILRPCILGPDIKKEEYKADMEVLMNDLFDLIKQNEELKEEITEQCSMVENSRSVVKELKTTITEKAAEIQQQKHEIRRLSLAVETGEGDSRMQSDFDRCKQVNQIREETQNRLDDLESINSELRARLDEYEATKDSLKNQYNKMKQKLELEREQNAELNRQLLEVSDLYDMYYTKCGELEKGRIKGIDNPLGGQQIEGDAIQRSLGDLILTQEDLGHAGKEDMLNSQGSEESMETRSGDDVKSEHASSSKIDSSKKKSKSEIQPSSQSDTRLQSKDESVLMAIVNLTKLLFLVTATFIIVTTLRIYYGFSVGQILSTVFATYVFLYNLWRILSKREQSGNDRDESKNGMQKLRRAMQDLILRLDERNFKEFREIYESFIVQSFDEQEINRSRNLEVEIQYLTSSKDALSRELARYKEMNKPQISDYNQLKREIDVLRIKRIEEDEVSQRVIQSLKDDIKAMEVHLSAKVDVIDDGDILNRFMQGSLLKLLLFAVLEGLLLMSVSSSFLLIPASFLSLVLLALMYKTDLNLRYTSNENRGYQKTIKELLRKVNDYREEGKQISDEVRELEAMVDKDYHIISKQRHAIERLERQLQRAINKYREKKRTLERFVWLQEKNISDFVGLDDSEASKHSGVDVLFSKKSHSDIEHEDKSTWIWFCFKILLVALIAYAAVTRYQIYGLPLSYSDIDPFYLAGALTCVGLIFIFAKHRFWQRSMLQRTSLKAQLQETREDEKILVEQIDVLRSLLSNEREIVAKLEKQIEDVKELPGRKIPKEEVNAVIDRLIEVSKHRDELVMTASSAKDKYDHIKKTLEDILSREKYLSEEVSSLRTQKRELQNDLMKEQLKNIDMYEEVKKAKNDSNKEEGIAQKSETEWDFYIDDFIKNSTGTEGGMPLESELVLESDSVIESLEHAGSYAQKNRKKRSLKRRQKQQEQSSKDVVNGEQMLQTLQDDEADSGDKEERDKKKDITEEESESIAVNEVESNLELVKNGEKQVEHLQQLSADDVRIFDRHSDQGARNEERSTESIEKPIDSVDFFNRNREIIGVPGPVNDLSKFDKNENSLLKKIIAQAKLLDAKDWELDHLKYLLEASNLNISRENSDSGTDCEKKFNDSNMKDCQQEIRKLANEVFSLADLCRKGEVHVNAVELEEVTSRPEDFFNYLTEHVLLTKYKLSADKADMVAKVSAMEEEVEEARQKIEKLHAEVAKEEQTRSHLISEYEKEYERLESCLGDAYEKVRKSLLEERSLRGEIMNQYEDEIEDIQTKTAEVLKGLQDQLKKERKEKEKAQTQVEGMGKRIKELEVELNAIEEVEKSNQVYVNLQDLRLEANEGEQGKMQQSHTVTLKGLAEEEAYKRTRVLKEKLNEAEQSIDEYRIKLNEKDLIIGRFEKHEKDLRVKMDTQSKRMKDLENEIRSPAIVKDGNAWTGKHYKCIYFTFTMINTQIKIQKYIPL